MKIYDTIFVLLNALAEGFPAALAAPKDNAPTNQAAPFAPLLRKESQRVPLLDLGLSSRRRRGNKQLRH